MSLAFNENKNIYYYSLSLFILFLSCLYNDMFSASTNVSSLIIDGGRVLSGEGLYSDIPEINPPASVLLYIPSVWIENIAGIKAEHVTVFLTIFILFVSIELSARVLYYNNLIENRGLWVFLSIFSFGSIALDSFAEREHIALIMILPILSIVASRLEGKSVSSSKKILFGIMAGVAVCIKPHFAAAIFIPQAYVAFKRRSLASIFCLENVTTFICFIFYWVIVIKYYGIYFENILPQALDVYVAYRMPLVSLLAVLLPLLIVFAASMALVWEVSPKWLRSIDSVLLLASLGFLVAYISQGKIWSYHYYPAAALMLLVSLDLMATKLNGVKWGESSLKRRLMASFIVMTSFVFVEASLFKPIPQDSLELVELIKNNYESPKVISISGDVGVSNPLIRRVNGRSASNGGCCIITENVHNILRSTPDISEEKKNSLNKWENKDREALIHDFVKWRPDVLLIDTRTWFVDWVNWIKQDEGLTALVCQYEVMGKTKSVALLFRRNNPSSQAPCNLII